LIHASFRPRLAAAALAFLYPFTSIRLGGRLSLPSY
jgi:hypothetical protein